MKQRRLGAGIQEGKDSFVSLRQCLSAAESRRSMYINKHGLHLLIDSPIRFGLDL